MKRAASKKKAAHNAQPFQYSYENKTLLDFAFFVFHVLSRNGVVFLDDHFFCHGTRVFLCDVEMACPRRGVQTNLDRGWLGHVYSPAAARLGRGAA